MTPQAAQELLAALQQQTRGIEELLERARLLGSTWSCDQLELFLLSMKGIERDASGLYRSIGRSMESEIQAAIVDAVRSFAGKPVAANQVRARLPSHFITTDEQVLALARRTAGLQVFGPQLIRTTP
jgi:hypothetical protein